jgi:hypothetical protein
MKITVKRCIMSGLGPKYTYYLESDGKIMFKTSSNSYKAWTKKKDALRIVNAIEVHGLEYVEEKLNCKAFIVD